MNRTPQNCTIADRVYDRENKERYTGKYCSAVRNESDEPIDKCKKCKWCCIGEEGEQE